jgi:hypothetical protein
MVASIALGYGGKALVSRVTSEKEAVTASTRWRLFVVPAQGYRTHRATPRLVTSEPVRFVPKADMPSFREASFQQAVPKREVLRSTKTC